MRRLGWLKEIASNTVERADAHRIRKEALVAGTEGATHSTSHSFAHRRRGLDDVDPACEIADVLRRFGLFRHANSPTR
ncbi:hypothetical protein [Sinorhizobium sp. BJ1]|uniref:hypothetical protein n=1 Tax=Sinorhizobium sp. BJ1 TaxID=2035455 RepID=UPI000BE82C58|nr:hypothetical protein [Sinorhizobium sp. BJ1]PDT81041.1 hypothetical protein CO676_24215 [Sinorhizobium sp. BJ1]